MPPIARRHGPKGNRDQFWTYRGPGRVRADCNEMILARSCMGVTAATSSQPSAPSMKAVAAVHVARRSETSATQSRADNTRTPLTLRTGLLLVLGAAFAMATAGPAAAQITVEHETVVDTDPGTVEVEARGAAVVETAPAPPATATSDASIDGTGPGARSGSGEATTGANPGTAAAEASVSAEDGDRSGHGAAEIVGATGSASSSSDLGPGPGLPLSGEAHGVAIIDSATGSAAAVSDVWLGDVGTTGGAGTNLGETVTSSDSEVGITGADEVAATTTAVSKPSVSAGGPAILEIDPRISVEPLLADRTFSTSTIERSGEAFLAGSESLKGAESGSAFSVSDAGSDTIVTTGASGGDAGTGPTSSFSQAISVPAEGENALFASGIAESMDGGSTYSLSMISSEPAPSDSEPAIDFALSVTAFEGNGLAHADALAGLTYGEIDVQDAFDADTLSGVAFSIAEVLTPTADVESIIRVEGDGTTMSRSALVMVGLESVQTLAGAVSGIAASTVDVNLSLHGNTVVEGVNARETQIVNSGIGSRGLINVNQDAGNSTNQSNITSIAWTDSPTPLLLNQVSGSVSTTGNTLQTAGGDRSNVIDGSFKDMTGILGVNQNTGSLNQLTNVLAIALGLGGGGVALQDVSLGSVHADNTIEELGEASGNQQNIITGGSFDGFSGIALVTQNGGDLNQVTTMVLVSATVQ